MFKDFTIFLWLLKLGALVNLYLLVNTFMLPASAGDAHILLPARVFLAVSAYRCLFPVVYKDNVVFHNSPLSSIFLTRLFATFSEVGYIYLLSYMIRRFNLYHAVWVDILSWVMVLQVSLSQCFVWGAILTRRLMLYFYEELGWAIIFVLNTVASVFLYLTVDLSGGAETLIQINLLFGPVYLVWQYFNLSILYSDGRRNDTSAGSNSGFSWTLLKRGLNRSIHEKNRRVDADAWGRLIGLTWMTGYWATLLPLWVNQIVATLLH